MGCGLPWEDPSRYICQFGADIPIHLGRSQPGTFSNASETNPLDQPAFPFCQHHTGEKNTTGFKLDNTIQGFAIFFSRGCIICLSMRYTSCLSQTSSQVFQMKRFEKVKTFTFYISTVLDLRFLFCVQCCA